MDSSARVCPQSIIKKRRRAVEWRKTARSPLKAELILTSAPCVFMFLEHCHVRDSAKDTRCERNGQRCLSSVCKNVAYLNSFPYFINIIFAVIRIFFGFDNSC